MAANLVKLISSDNKTFEVGVAVAMESKMVQEIIAAKGIDEPIPLPHVSGDTLAKVVEYCKFHAENKLATPKDVIKAWDADFVKFDRENAFAITEHEIEAWNLHFMKVERDKTLFDLFRAARDMKIKNLMKLTTQTLLDTLRSREEFREKSIRNREESMLNMLKKLNIENDFTPEEEAEFGMSETMGIK